MQQTTNERKFSIWRKIFGMYAVYDCELTDEEVDPYRHDDYWIVQEDTGDEWPYEWKGNE